MRNTKDKDWSMLKCAVWFTSAFVVVHVVNLLFKYF